MGEHGAHTHTYTPGGEEGREGKKERNEETKIVEEGRKEELKQRR